MTSEDMIEREKQAERILKSIQPETTEDKIGRIENIVDTIRIQNIGIMKVLKEIQEKK